MGAPTAPDVKTAQAGGVAGKNVSHMQVTSTKETKRFSFFGLFMYLRFYVHVYSIMYVFFPQ